ncbi:hypothetical protein HDF16_003227 [Granulicella aggregans]|uniref:Uncharacterized protein n=1 Tax=Granulicella aggregans TaxID=474949 RepID=A0A7W7ZF28_9BACT|nr:hypothetical protein [Granulicella aggregans]MBB5058513.1 hypothetical protein [Granulicella aggregans]
MAEAVPLSGALSRVLTRYATSSAEDRPAYDRRGDRDNFAFQVVVDALQKQRMHRRTLLCSLDLEASMDVIRNIDRQPHLSNANRNAAFFDRI